MALEHDGISCPLPPKPLQVVLGLAVAGGGGWLVSQGYTPWGITAIVIALPFFLNQIGKRRVKVIHSKLLVEDEHLIGMLLLGPTRRRIPWEEVKSVAIDGRSLRMETTTGAPFITANGADPDELKALVSRIEDARENHRLEAARGV